MGRNPPLLVPGISGREAVVPKRPISPIQMNSYPPRVEYSREVDVRMDIAGHGFEPWIYGL